MAQEFLTLKQAAEQLSTTESKLIALAKSREIRAFADGGSWKFRRQDVEQYAARHADSIRIDDEDEDLVRMDESGMWGGADENEATVIGMRGGQGEASSVVRFDDEEDSGDIVDDQVALADDSVSIPSKKKPSSDSSQDQIRLEEDEEGFIDQSEATVIGMQSGKRPEVNPDDSGVQFVSLDDGATDSLMMPAPKSQLGDVGAGSVALSASDSAIDDSDVKLSIEDSGLSLDAGGSSGSSSRARKTPPSKPQKPKSDHVNLDDDDEGELLIDESGLWTGEGAGTDATVIGMSSGSGGDASGILFGDDVGGVGSADSLVGPAHGSSLLGRAGSDSLSLDLNADDSSRRGVDDSGLQLDVDEFSLDDDDGFKLADESSFDLSDLGDGDSVALHARGRRDDESGDELDSISLDDASEEVNLLEDSDLTGRGAASGINLGSPDDSGLSLEPLDTDEFDLPSMGGSSSVGKRKASSSIKSAGDSDFDLALDDDDFSTDAESGSDVVPLSDLDDGEEEAADEDFDDFPAAAPAAAAVPRAMPAAAAAQPALPWPTWTIPVLSITALMFMVVGMMMFELMRHAFSFRAGYADTMSATLINWVYEAAKGIGLAS